MGVHDDHEGLAGFDDRQILHDGCTECERRGRDVLVALGAMGHAQFAATARRAVIYRSGSSSARDELCVARSERYLLDVVGTVITKLVSAPFNG